MWLTQFSKHWGHFRENHWGVVWNTPSPPQLATADWAGPNPFVPQFCSEGPKGQASWDAAMSTLRNSLWGLKSSVWRDGTQAFPLFPVVTKRKAMERLSYQTTGRLKGQGKECILDEEVGEFVGPEKSFLIINGGSTTAVAWKRKDRRQKSPVCGSVLLWLQACPPDTVPHRRSEGRRSPCHPHLATVSAGHLLPGSGAVSTMGEEMKLLIAVVFEICSFQGISGIRNEILALISHICWVLRP